MAHNAHIASLTRTLVGSTLSGSKVNELQRLALTVFAKASVERTNQFNVKLQLEGLEEKARILNNDLWADAIHDRFQELSLKPDNWIPEILSFLLQLSDRPVSESRLEELTLSRPVSPPAILTWADILANDPLDDQDDIWEDVDFRDGESSEDDNFETAPADASDRRTEPSRPDSEAIDFHVETLIESYEQEELEQLRGAQFWNVTPHMSFDPLLTPEVDQPLVLLTVSQVAREVVFMLLGLPTSIYMSKPTDQIVLSQNVGLRRVSRKQLVALLTSFAEIGEKLQNVRRWIRSTTHLPLEQTFQTSLAVRLKEVDRTLDTVQARFLDGHNDIASSLSNLYDEVSRSSRLVQQSSEILISLAEVPHSHLPFRIMECLFNKVCTNQMIGDSGGYAFMARLFFDCFYTYIKPIRLWVEEGLLDRRDGTMFIIENQEDVPLSSLWQDKFYLVRNASGDLHAPDFLHLAARKIFNSGKSIYLLHKLGYQMDEPWSLRCNEPTISFEHEGEEADDGRLVPFPVLFDMAFDRWIASMHYASSSILREQLDKVFSLQRSLDALGYLYFCRNGALSSKFTSAVFEKMEWEHHGWNASFALTELLQNAYRTITCIDIGQIEVRKGMRSSHGGSQRTGRHMGALENVCVNYILPWPVANILRPDSIEVYQRVFILLMQMQRAKWLLQRQEHKRHSLAVDEKPSLLMYAVRHQLLWFTDTMLTYLTHMVLSATTAAMRGSMTLAVDLDGMIEVHDTYIGQLKHRCFLTKQHGPLHQAIVSLLDLTILYSDIHTGCARPAVLKVDLRNGESKSMSGLSAMKSKNGFASDDSSDNSESEQDPADAVPPAATIPSDTEKLSHIRDTFSKLHSFITSAVQSVSKADGAPCWEILASNLAAGSR